jgi:type III pantothenate kinase
MASPHALPLLAVDIGNTRLKLGWFESPAAEPLPQPSRVETLAADWTLDDLTAALPRGAMAARWLISSVHRPSTARLVEWLSGQQVEHTKTLTHRDLPLVIDLVQPERVGMDRLVNAVAANRLRRCGEPAVVIDFGTAIKVDYIDRKGAFAGGAIAPGIGMSARALHEFTDLLPQVELDASSPAALGKSTLEAIRSGLYWGAVGTVRELVAQLTADSPAAQIFLSGGDAPDFAAALAAESAEPPRFIPHLTLSGIALTAPHVWPAGPSP